jgi:hypothetical protein
VAYPSPALWYHAEVDGGMARFYPLTLDLSGNIRSACPDDLQAPRNRLRDLMVDRMDQNSDIVSRHLNEQEFEAVAYAEMATRICEEIRGKQP